MILITFDERERFVDLFETADLTELMVPTCPLKSTIKFLFGGMICSLPAHRS
jgi:hypothetical protein